MNDQSLHIPNADAIIEKFGGIRPMATKLGMPVTTVQGWKKRNVIPANRKDQIILSAEQHQIDVTGLIQVVSGPVTAPPANRDAMPRHIYSSARSSQNVIDLPDLDDQPAPRATVSAAYVPPRPASTPAATAQKPKAANATWIAVMIVAAAVLVGLLAMGPGVNRIVVQEQRLASMETEMQQLDKQMATVQSENSLLRGLIPENLKTQIDSLRSQAAMIEDAVTTVSLQAKELSNDILGPDAGTMEQRLAKVEGQMKKLAEATGSTGLPLFLQKLQVLQSQVPGRETLAALTGELRTAILTEPPKSEKDLQAKLVAATQHDGLVKDAMADLSATDYKAAAMLLALAQFRTALAREDKPFDQDLALVRELVARDNPDLRAALDRLAPKAKSGVLTPAGLGREFKQLAGDIVTASLSGEDVSIGEKAQARIHEVLKLEKNGESLTGTATQQAIDKAQNQLDQGDVAGAIATLQALDGKAAEKASSWVSEAEATLQAQQVKDLLTRTVSAQISLQPFAGQLGSYGGGINLQALTQGVVQSLGGGTIYDPASGFRMAIPARPLVPAPVKLKGNN